MNVSVKKRPSRFRRTHRATASLPLVILLQVLVSSSSAQSNHWNQTNGPPGGQTYALVALNDGLVFVSVEGILFRSTNAGNSWESVDFEEEVLALTVDSTDGVWAGTRRGIYQTSDGGTSWNPRGLNDEVITSLTFSSSNGWFAAGSKAIYRSIDGLTWSRVAEPSLELQYFPVRFLKSTSSGDVYVSVGPGPLGGGALERWDEVGWTRTAFPKHASDIAENTNGFLYAATVGTHYDYRGGLFYSADGGASWVQGFSEDVYAVTIDEHETAYIGAATDVYAFQNGFWSGLGLESHATVRLEAKSGVVFAGTGVACAVAVDWVPGACSSPAGVFRLADGEWTSTDMPEAHATVVALSDHNSGRVYAASLEGFFHTSDKGNSWTRTTPYARDDQWIYDQIQDLTVTPIGTALLSAGGGLYLISPNGDRWHRVLDYPRALLVKPDGSLLAYTDKLGTHEGGFFSSSDDGLSWTRIESNIDDVNSLARDPAGLLFAGTDDGVYQSSDHGFTWTPAGLQGNGIRRLRFSEDSALYAMVIKSHDERIYVSRNEGDSWKEILPPATGIRDVLPVGDERLIIYSSFGLWYTLDEGNSWVSWNVEWKYDLEVLHHGADGYLYAGARDLGVFRSSFPAGSVTVDPVMTGRSGWSLGRSYPNPSAGLIIVPFTLGSNSFIEISVFDMLGRRVTVLTSQALQSGSHEVQWNTAELPPGVYAVRLVADSFTDSRLAVVGPAVDSPIKR